MRRIYLYAYYGFARFLPASYTPIVGNIARWIRYQLCKRIFKKCGRNVNIERMAFFENGSGIEIGDNSGLGVNCVIPQNTIIGENVMMGPNCYIFRSNHAFNRIDIPMRLQGYSELKQTIIEDDVWIGRNVTITPGRIIKKGTIVGACCLLSKDFPEYSVIGGNPGEIIYNRKENNK